MILGWMDWSNDSTIRNFEQNSEMWQSNFARVCVCEAEIERYYAAAATFESYMFIEVKLNNYPKIIHFELIVQRRSIRMVYF